MSTILVTGAGGLVGATAVEYYSRRGARVLAVENGLRQQLLGEDGNTLANLDLLKELYPENEYIDLDVRSEAMNDLLAKADVVIHAAAQPSHPRSIEIPLEDASINIQGTLNLLEGLRSQGKTNTPFIFCSTNKVYGDAPNELDVVERETRYVFREYPWGIDENLKIDGIMHTPFGVSKAAADLYVQEYGKLYGMPTGSFRMSCITGPWSRPTVYQNWIAFFMLQALRNEPLVIYGWKGKQVRDNIDARDLVAAFDMFARRPRPGEVYNMGGGNGNSVSCLETVSRIQHELGRPMAVSFGPAREADHRVYVTDMRKFQSHYSEWSLDIGIDQIFDDLFRWVRKSQDLTDRAPAMPTVEAPRPLSAAQRRVG